MNKYNTRNLPYKLGIALSGGGARGLAHVGVLTALMEYKITPDIMSGVSAGSIIAALFCAGYSPQQIKQMFEGEHFSSFARLTVPRSCFFNSEGFKEFLDHHLGDRTFNDLEIPLRVIATDIDNGKSVVLNKGRVADAVLASSSIPVIFPPVEIEGIHYVDGGVLRNLPVLPIRHECNYILGVDVNPLKLGKFKDNIISIAERSYYILFRSNTAEDKRNCDILIETPGVADFSIFDLKHIPQIVDCGYQATIKVLKNEIS